ncbi:putative EF-hand domain pair protein CML [Helianthus anomalus]
MNSYESSTKPTSPGSSFTRFFRRLLSSPSTKPPSSSAPISSNSDDIHQVFNYFDENGDGMISATELQNRMRKVGGEEVQLSDEEAEMAVRSSDADGDGVLGLDDFAKMMKEGEEEELKGAFGMYSGRDGRVITPKSLKKMMRRLGQSTTVNECKEMIGRFDVNGDGVLDFDEFRAMMS